VACAAWSLLIYRLAIAHRLPEADVDRYAADVDRYVADVCPPPAGE